MIDTIKFIEVWQKAETIKEVVDKMGISKSRASGYRTFLKTKGVDLKNFRNSQKRDWVAMNKLAQSFIKK